MKDRRELAITLRLSGRPIVVVGEGPVAERYRASLKRKGALLVGEGSKAQFAIVVDDAAAVSRLKVRGTLVYAVDRPDLSDFTLPQPKAAKQRRKLALPAQRDRWRPALAKAHMFVARASQVARSASVRAQRVARTGRAWVRPISAPFFGIADIVAATIRVRHERALARPVVLNLALARGGPLDDIPEQLQPADRTPEPRLESRM